MRISKFTHTDPILLAPPSIPVLTAYKIAFPSGLNPQKLAEFGKANAHGGVLQAGSTASAALTYYDQVGTSLWSYTPTNIKNGSGADLWGPYCVDMTNNKILGFVTHDPGSTNTPNDLTYFDVDLDATGTITTASTATSVWSDTDGGTFYGDISSAAEGMCCRFDATNFYCYYRHTSDVIYKMTITRSTGAVASNAAFTMSGLNIGYTNISYMSTDETVAARFEINSSNDLDIALFRDGYQIRLRVPAELLGMSLPATDNASKYITFMDCGDNVFAYNYIQDGTLSFGQRLFDKTEFESWLVTLAKKHSENDAT